MARSKKSSNEKLLVESFEDVQVDSKAYAKKILNLIFTDERTFEVVKRRADGETLIGIGRTLDLTRERIRQIELKAIRNFLKFESAVKKIFQNFQSSGEQKTFLYFEDMKMFLDEDDAKIFWFFISKSKFNSDIFHFDKSINAIVFHESINFEEEVIKKLPVIVEEKDFNKLIKKIANKKNYSEEFIRTKLDKIYRRKGNAFYRGKIYLNFEYSYILKKFFPAGFKISEKNAYDKFVRHLKEVFNEKTPFTQHSVDAIMGRIGILCARGKYIHPDFINVPAEIMDKVKDFIERSGRTAIFYKEIYESLKEIFVGTQITSHYFLQGAIKFYKLPYILRKEYLTKSDESDVSKEFEKFVNERGEVTAQEIKEKFVSFNDSNINFLLERCPEILRVGYGIFIHSSRLNLTAEDKTDIKKFIQENCTKPLNSRFLFTLLSENFADFMTRNKIKSHTKLFGILKYMFSEDFNFSHSYISLENIHDITNKKIILNILQDKEKININELAEICSKNHVHYVTKSYLVDALSPEFIRLDEFDLIRPEKIGVTDEIVSEIGEMVRAEMNKDGGWQMLSFFDYDSLPKIEMDWNNFLLESVISMAKNAPHKLKTPFNSPKFSSVIFLSEEFEDDNFKSFLLKILKVEHSKKPFQTDKEILQWLKEKGICNTKLPKFLDKGNAFNLLQQ